MRENRATTSTYEVALAFGSAANGPPESSDLFGSVATIDEPYDGLSFADGIAEPGAAATFTMIVTDETPRPTFLIVQHALLVVADGTVPPPTGLETQAAAGYSLAGNPDPNDYLSGDELP